MRKSSHATQELCNLQKKQVLKDTLVGDSPIKDLEVDESDENKGKVKGEGMSRVTVI